MKKAFRTEVFDQRVHSPGSRLALTRDQFVNRVAEALCREWCCDRDASTNASYDDYSFDARFWEDFRHESQIAILAFLEALEEAGYRIFHPDDARRETEID